MKRPSKAPHSADARRGAARGSLRRVVAHIANKDQLECGHVILTARYSYGERYPARRRCHRCKKEQAL